MGPNLPFLSAASNTILKPGGLLRWKVPLVKDARLSKIVRLTSPLSDALPLSSPRPMLRHGKRLALLSCPSLTLNPCTLFFSLLLAPLPHLPPLQIFKLFLCFSPRESASVLADFLRSHFSVSQPKALRSRARGYFSGHVP